MVQIDVEAIATVMELELVLMLSGVKEHLDHHGIPLKLPCHQVYLLWKSSFNTKKFPLLIQEPCIWFLLTIINKLHAKTAKWVYLHHKLASLLLKHSEYKMSKYKMMLISQLVTRLYSKLHWNSLINFKMKFQWLPQHLLQLNYMEISWTPWIYALCSLETLLL